MQISVGSVVKFRDREWLCTRITKREWSEFARANSEQLEADHRRLSNVHTIELTFGVFLENDVVHGEQEVVELIIPGSDVFFIYTYHRLRKEVKDGLERSEDAVEQGADGSAQAAREEYQGRTGARAEGAGADGNALHSDG